MYWTSSTMSECIIKFWNSFIITSYRTEYGRAKGLFSLSSATSQLECKWEPLLRHSLARWRCNAAIHEPFLVSRLYCSFLRWWGLVFFCRDTRVHCMGWRVTIMWAGAASIALSWHHRLHSDNLHLVNMWKCGARLLDNGHGDGHGGA